MTTYCSRGVREDERRIDVIDTPGVLGTAPVSLREKAMNVPAYILETHETEKTILREIAHMFAMAPDGFHAFILVLKYGCRFTPEDARALKTLQTFLGKDATEYMIILFTFGDQAEYSAKERGETVEQTLEEFLKHLPSWLQKFIAEIKGRALLFNNKLRPDKEPKEYKKQLSRLITVRSLITN